MFDLSLGVVLGILAVGALLLVVVFRKGKQ